MAKREQTLRTVRAGGVFDEHGVIEAAATALAPDATPVLIVPEAAVRGCRHRDAHQAGYGNAYCPDCGSFHDGFRWLRPRVLKGGR